MNTLATANKNRCQSHISVDPILVYCNELATDDVLSDAV